MRSGIESTLREWEGGEQSTPKFTWRFVKPWMLSPPELFIFSIDNLYFS